MLLRVIGKPTADMCCTHQRLAADYNPSTGVHTIECDVDVVTLGVAIGVLRREFEECLAGLEPDIAERIRRTTEEVVLNEQDRS